MRIIGHRGAIYNNDNTVESISSVFDYEDDGLELGVEIDVQMLKDGNLICYHDKYYEGELLSKLKLVDLDNTVPTLDDIINLFTDKNSYLIDIEIKVYENESKINKLIDKLFELLSRYDTVNYIITSFNELLIMEILKRTNFRVGLIYHQKLEFEKIKRCYEFGIRKLVFNKELISEGLRLRETMDFELFIYTFFNDEQEIKVKSDTELLEGLKGEENINIITDRIEIAKDILKN